MTKLTILAIAISLTLASCKENTDKQSTNNVPAPSNEQVALPAPRNEEPVLKYGHVFSGDCAATSLDWPGEYLGAVVNKDNGTARLRLTLNKDWTYTLKVMALENLPSGDVKENLQKEYKGTFTFDKAGQNIKLLGTNHPATNDMISVRVEENRLSVLDGNMKELNKDGDMNTLYK